MLIIHRDKIELIREISKQIGIEDGKSAGSWIFDGNSKREDYEYILKGLDEGDPEVYDKLPYPDLSGEWADSRTSTDLVIDTYFEYYHRIDPESYKHLVYTGFKEEPYHEDFVKFSESFFHDICNAYDEGFMEAVEDEVRRQIRYQLEDT